MKNDLKHEKRYWELLADLDVERENVCIMASARFDLEKSSHKGDGQRKLPKGKMSG